MLTYIAEIKIQVCILYRRVVEAHTYQNPFSDGFSVWRTFARLGDSASWMFMVVDKGLRGSQNKE